MESLLTTLASDGFGHWLAGLVDGEGSFTITPNRPGFVCRLSVSLREDDAEVLQEIASRLGIGTVTHRPRPSSDTTARRPQVVWRVTRKQDCLTLVAILDRFPLRAKKSRDYAIWRQAVIAMADMQREPMERKGNGRWQRQPLDWSPIADLKEQLRRVRDGDLQHDGMGTDPIPGDSAGSRSLHRR